MKKLLIALSCLISVSVYSQSITNMLGADGFFTIKDAASNYLTVTQSTGQVNILRTLQLENTSSSTTGVMFKGADRFMHNYGTSNLFLGVNSGNFNMSGYENTTLGTNALKSNTTGYQNTVVEKNALYSNVSVKSKTI